MSKKSDYAIEQVSVNKYLSLYDIRYKEGKHYYNASRRKEDKLVALLDDDEFKCFIPDAVTITVVLHLPDKEPQMLLFYEYRYPVGRYMLSTVAGLIDPEDELTDNPLVIAAIREIKEETGIEVKESDRIKVVNPCLFSSPGMTDECNAFLRADIYLDDLSGLTHSNIVGSEKMKDFILLNKEAATSTYLKGVDDNGIPYSLSTLAAISFFINE